MRLRASQIAIERGGRRLCSNLSFELGKGEALIVVGPNGAGKTSLLRAIVGLLPLAEGSISAEGGDDEASVGEQAHYLGHADALKGALTARENLEFWAALLAQGGSAKTPLEALKRLGLAHVLDLPVRALSAGQKRRVALARLLAASRPLWLLDEPLTALDEAAQRLCLDVLREHLAGGGLVIAATHAPIGLAGASELRLGGAEAL
ncbi:MAG TPA: heme ABC exporter ATP-binding protein CcmA [Roseiarcus sp.]|nr:heme ABC exporter ATP-binding protein CcmA [Roseiarcus sp.]